MNPVRDRKMKKSKTQQKNNPTDIEFLETLTDDKLKNFFILLVDKVRVTNVQVDLVRQTLEKRGIDLKAELKQ